MCGVLMTSRNYIFYILYIPFTDLLYVFMFYMNLAHRVSLRKKSPYSDLFWSAFFPDFLAFGLNTEGFSRIRTEYREIVSLRIQSECEKIREK